MRKILNPFVNRNKDEYNCIACSPYNKIGLNLQFWEDDDAVICNWDPIRDFEGYHGVVHGGMQGLLMDEIAAWTVYVKCGTGGVTAGMEIKYRKPASSVNGSLKLVSKVLEQNARLAKLSVHLYNANGVLASESVVSYFLFPLEKAKKEYMYPGIEAFFE